MFKKIKLLEESKFKSQYDPHTIRTFIDVFVYLILMGLSKFIRIWYLSICIKKFASNKLISKEGN